MVDYVVYLALILTYSSLRSQVQTRSSPRPRPRSIVISYSRPPMISRMRSRRTPSRSMPRSTSRSPPKAMATLSCSTRAGDLPRAIMIRPQFGSAPLSAVFTSGEFATLRAASSASRRLAAPRTAIATSFVAPSPSATSARASRCISASRPAANCASLGRGPPTLRGQRLGELRQCGADLVHRQRDTDDAGRGDQDMRRGNPQQLADEPSHLARVADPALTRAHVGAAARGDDRLGLAAARVLHGDAHRGALDLVRGEPHGGARGRRRVDQREILLPARLNARRHAAREDPGHRRDAALEPLDDLRRRHRVRDTREATRAPCALASRT